MTIHLETPRLILRQFKYTDLESFLSYRNDPEVAKYQGWSVPYPRRKATVFVRNMAVADVIQNHWLQIAIEMKSTHEMVGDVAFFLRKEDRHQASLGYTVARPHWGKGYASEAVSRLLSYLFDELKLHRVAAECDVENRASWKLLEKLGFRREAHLLENYYHNGTYGSEYYYAMLAREWVERQPAPRVQAKSPSP